MNNHEEENYKPEQLELVLSRKLGQIVRHVSYEMTQLQGGTLGNVRLVTGVAETLGGERIAYKVVWKIQKKWERYGDPDSWRREYDLYASGFDKLFTGPLRMPECYYAEISEEGIQLWMEYIDGVSGLRLTPDMYVRAAEELGRFQGKLYTEQPDILHNLTNLNKVEFAQNFYQRYRSWPVVYDYIRSEECEIPQHLCHMLIDLDTRSEEIFSRFAKLPIVLCHRDFWVENIICAGREMVLIDWDTAGWGYMGEDIASVRADEEDVPHMLEFYQNCVPAYYKAFAEYADVSSITDPCVYELILVMFGYRLVEWYKFAETPETKSLHLNTLQKIYEMRRIG